MTLKPETSDPETVIIGLLVLVGLVVVLAGVVMVLAGIWSDPRWALTGTVVALVGIIGLWGLVKLLSSMD